VPTTIRQTELNAYTTNILSCVKSLYVGSIEEGIWRVDNPFVVQEGIHDDLIFCVASALRNYESLGIKFGIMGIKFGIMGIQKAVRILEKAVANYDPFSLPTIWESSLRMIWRGRNEFAKMFLSKALELATIKHGLNHPFVQVINLLLQVEKIDPHLLEKVIVCAYRSCVDHVKQQLSSSHLTALSLWSDFIVYVDNSSASEIEQAGDSFGKLIRKSEKDNGVDNDTTLEILGQKLYLLQSTTSRAEEAEQVARDLLRRVNRRIRNGERLEGKLLIKWKDLKHTLGNFCHAKGELMAATMHLEESLIHGVVEDIDTIALERLEAWYKEQGETNEARLVRQLRIDNSQTLLQED
jgi:hypothetical protein